MDKNKNLNVIEFLQLIRKRPAMYFGDDVGLTSLFNMTLGFEINSQKPSLPPFDYFSHWLAQKFNISDSIGFSSYLFIILNICDNNELKAFNKFYELLDEFLLIIPRRIYETDLDDNNFTFYYSKPENRPHRYVNIEEEKTTIYPAPYHIKVIEFDNLFFVYFYDFEFMCGNTKKGELFYKNFSNYEDLQEEFNIIFGKLKWQEVDKNNIKKVFKEIVSD